MRPRGSILVANKKRGGELDDVMEEVSSRGDAELEDIASEVAARAADDDGWGDTESEVASTVAVRKPATKVAVQEKDEEDIKPMHAGAVPLPPGKIAVNPMAGMDGELNPRADRDPLPRVE